VTGHRCQGDKEGSCSNLVCSAGLWLAWSSSDLRLGVFFFPGSAYEVGVGVVLGGYGGGCNSMTILLA